MWWRRPKPFIKSAGRNAPLSFSLCGVLCCLLLAGCAPRGNYARAATSTRLGSHPQLASPSASPGSPVPTKTLISAVSPSPLDRWQPKLGLTWQIQLSGENVDDSYNVDVYDIDLFDASAEVVASLKMKGRKVICYFSAGTREDWRLDAADYPKEVIGKEDAGWVGENWVDIRKIEALAPILEERLDLCKEKGFDGADPDNVDGFANDTDFPLTAEDQVKFNRWLAGEAHKRGLAVGLKNDPEQAEILFADFDFTITEECFDQGWCDLLTPFLNAGKSVFDIEYTDTGIAMSAFCPDAKDFGISVLYKHRELDAWTKVCP